MGDGLGTFVIERSYPATPERVFGAFADPTRKRRWFVEGDGHEVEHYEMAGYGGVREYAKLLGQKDIMALLDATLKEEEAADKKLTLIAKEVNAAALGNSTIEKAN